MFAKIISLRQKLALVGKGIIFYLFKTFRKKLEEEISKLKGKILNKDEEFTRTADGLERELEAVRDQMKQSQKDRDRTLKDKETLLEEVKYIRIYHECLERELEAVRDQMKKSQKDRDRTLKDKETLLQEVKYTVNPVFSGHSKRR